MPSNCTTALMATPITAIPIISDPADTIAATARPLLPNLELGGRISAAKLRAAMERSFGGADAQGASDCKTAYDSREAATVLFLRRFGQAICSKAASPAAILPMLAKIGGLLPTYASHPLGGADAL